MSFVEEWIPEEKNDRLMVLIGGCILLVCGYFLFFYQAEMGLLTDAVSIGSIHTDGTIRNRHARSLKWGNLNSEGTVYLRDIVYTPKNTWAEFRWGDNKKITLEPESMVQFDDVSLDKIEIVLFEGQIRGESAKDVKIQKAEKFELIAAAKSEKSDIEDVSYFELRTSELTQRLSGLKENKLDFEPLVNARNPVLGLKQLEDFAVRLLYPPNLKFDYNSAKWIGMRFQKMPLPNVDYQIEIALNGAWGQAIKYPANQPEIAVQFDGVGGYSWRVISTRGRERVDSVEGEFEIVAKGGMKVESPRSLSSQGQKEGKGQKLTPPKLKPPSPGKASPGNLLLGQ